jgi:pimeloyl-ACP methyl ester carboxylesterase
MSIAHTVVLLPALGEDEAQTAALRAAFEEATQVLRPDISVRGSSPVILEEPALAVLDALTSARTSQIVLIGHGWGAMVALQIAANSADRVAALILSTNARPETIAIRSLFYGVLRLIPATVVQQLGGRSADVAGLLDQVRPVDIKPLAVRAAAPALVIVGERDIANRGPSAALARSLPLGNLRVVPQAGPGWQTKDPQLVVELVADFLSRPT